MEYLIVFGSSLLVNFLTLYFVARKSKKFTKNLYTNPAFLTGDFLLIPLYFVFAWEFLNKNFEIFNRMNHLILTLLGIVSSGITLGFGIKFKLLKTVWIPHGIVLWVIAFLFLANVLILFQENSKDSSLVFASLFVLILHQILGSLFPKVIDKK